KAELEREREVQLAAIRAQKDQLLSSAFKAARRALFGQKAYGLDALGTEESVRNIEIPDLRAFHKKFARPNNCVLAVYGDIETDSVRSAVEKTLGEWQAASGQFTGSSNLKLEPLDSVKRVSETHDKKQAVLVVGFRGASLFDSDRYGLELLQESC